MQLHVKTIRRRLDAINQLRMERALASAEVWFQRVYHLLPLLLHYNHPLIPGFIDDQVPFGVCSFRMNEPQKRLIHEFIKGDWGAVEASSAQDPAIAAIYSMGSTSSVGQSFMSDLDIWVFPQPWVDGEAQTKLQDKCIAVAEWAKTCDVLVSFFVVDENRFRDNKHGALSHDDCGSTQQKLLLEEFYRTAVRLVGKRIAWYLVPVNMESMYDSYLQPLYDARVLDKNEWLDLGCLHSLSAQEYFSAALWQLHKSSDSPYKAILKALLLEAYAREYPRTRLLALELKQRLHNGVIVSFGLDPYCMILERVTNYLEAVNDTSRLDLVRRCFYLKANDTMNRGSSLTNWRREILRQLVKQWSWSRQKTEFLDNQANWKIEQVRKTNSELLDTMSKSYHNLRRFARQNGLRIGSSPSDINILTQKLHATLDQLPNKLTLVNSQISPDLFEEELSFFHNPLGGSKHPGWSLYKQSPELIKISNPAPLRHSLYLVRVVSWAYFNGLLTPRTRIHLPGKGRESLRAGLYELTYDLGNSILPEEYLSRPTLFQQQRTLRSLTLLLNLEDDPTLAPDGYQLPSRQEGSVEAAPLSYDGSGLLGSIDLIYQTSWGEVFTQHITGCFALKQALKSLVERIQPDIGLQQEIKLFCYSNCWRETVKDSAAQIVRHSMRPVWESLHSLETNSWPSKMAIHEVEETAS